MIDLRSDTVTKPTPGMLAAMMAAAVGDDVYGEDPTVNALEAKVAAYLGTESALFVPSGTMSNQIAIRVMCQPGDEILLEANSHIVLWECGAPAALSGVTTQTFEGQWGRFDLSHIQHRIRPDDGYSPRTRVISIENTHNRGGGTITPLSTIAEISNWARKRGLTMHLDGARIWNAIVATGVSAREWCQHFDTISVCFSKGLGAPVGSALAGSRDAIQKARRVRKQLGGGMRQAGFLAAACIYAMDHQIERLAEDHANAKQLAEAIASVPGFQLAPPKVETNLVWFDVDTNRYRPQELVAKWKAEGVLVSALGEKTIRACTHYGVTPAECERAAEVIRATR